MSSRFFVYIQINKPDIEGDTVVWRCVLVNMSIFRSLVLINLLVLVFPLFAAQHDLILLRNGMEAEAIVELVDDNEIVFRIDKKSPSQTIDIHEVYMIKFAKRGNVYVTPEGKRVTGETQVIDKDADVIYLVSGAEVPAYNLKVSDYHVSFLANKPKNKKSIPIAQTFSRSDVFLIKYKDGTKDKLSDISLKKKVEPQPDVVKADTQEEPAKEEPLQVVFHSVAKGETLTSIAKKYGVATDEIVEWNDLPAKLNTKSRLQSDMQLIIYLKSKD